MCGIIVARDLNHHNVNKVIWSQFERQKARGIEGFGVFDGNSIFKTPKLKKMRGWMRNTRNAHDFLMFHHRMPTSTINVRRAAHPFSTGDYFGETKYVLVHNGHISNNVDLWIDHEKLGITYSSELDDGTFNDSESLLWDVALTLEGKQEKLKAYGGIAFVAAKMVGDEITHLYFAKNFGRPLKMYRGKEGIMLSSEGMGEDIEENQLYTYNYKLNRLTHKYFKVPQYAPYEGTWNRTSTYTTPTNTCTNFGYTPQWRGIGTGSEVYNPAEWEDDQEFIIPRSTPPKPDASELILQEHEQTWYLYDYLETTSDEITVEDAYSFYMTQANGSFSEAFDLIDIDLDYFINHYPSAQRDAIVDTLEGTIRRLSREDMYVDDDSVDEEYMTDVEDYTPAPTQRLLPLNLIGAGQEG